MSTRILIAEDEPISRRLLQRQLESWGYAVTAVEDGTAALKELQGNEPPKLAILDWMMPGLEGPEVVREVRKAKPSSDVYALLLTAKSQKSDLLIGLDSGADDFLSKPFDAPELRARLRAGERIIRLHENLVQEKIASDFRASHDALTGLYNRGAIMNLLHREISRCARENGKLGVILGDVDHFKSINDTHGHAAGDRALIEVGRRMQSVLRPYDFLGRYGGEEFLVFTPGCGPNEIQKVAERVRLSVSKGPIVAGETSLDVTISLGMSVAGESETISELLKRADLALYEAKSAGRNICKFQPAPPPEAVTPLLFVGIPLLAPPASSDKIR